MHLISGDTLQRQITTREDNLDSWLGDKGLSDREVVSKLYLAALSRKPFEDEIVVALGHSDGNGKEMRRQTFEDLLWAIFNSKEFLFHH